MSGSHSAGSAVERQMRNWELMRSQRLDVPTPKRADVEEFFTISRQVGAGGAEVAALLAERLGWPIFDKEILDAMAGDDRLRRQVYDSMDERDLGWFEEALRSLMQSEFVKNDYFHKLSETVLSLARQGHGVYLGRGADLILPRNMGMRVRLVAPLEQRIERIAAIEKLDIEAARTEIERRQIERATFVRNRYRVEPNDPTRFDLIINVGRFTPAQTAEIILNASKRMG